MAEHLEYTVEDGIAVFRLDDGKANALGPPMLDALHAALDRALAEEVQAIVLFGRPGRFSAGFDLGVMGQGAEAVRAMVGRGAELALRFFECPVPVLIGATGHTLAMGAVLLLAVDERIGADGDYKVGLNEVAIKMTMPEFAILLARERLSKRHLQRAISQAEIYSPQGAVDAGYLDQAVPLDQLETRVMTRARELAQTLHPRAHRETKHALRHDAIQRFRQEVDAMLHD
ncbi:MAG: crotonase/enoyl-CoA hydratase family protein [Myxococcota bacterium]|nr:crotonase/enoyl-CoA hydratase family protein [Myxococcota bacterium]